MAETVKAPVKTPAQAPDENPERYVREICDEQKRRHTFPHFIFPAKTPA